MAAPENKSIHNLNGKWQVNKTLSDSFEPVLALQGVGFLTRKAIGAATLTLHISQSEGPPSACPLQPIADPAAEKVSHILVDQTLTGGIKGNSENRCADGRPRAHSDWLFGTVEGSTHWIRGPGAAAAAVRQYGDEFLGKGWPVETDANGATDADLLANRVVNQDAGRGWVATQIWGFQTAKDGRRRYTRNIVVTKAKERVAVQLVYDFVGERDSKDEDEDLSY